LELDAEKGCPGLGPGRSAWTKARLGLVPKLPPGNGGFRNASPGGMLGRDNGARCLRRMRPASPSKRLGFAGTIPPARLGMAMKQPTKRVKATKSRRRRTTISKRARPSSTNLKKQLAERSHQLDEALKQLSAALDQQTATSEVLKVISGSQGDLQPVFNAMLKNAARICSAQFATLWLAEGEGFRVAAMHNTPGPLAKQRRTAGFHIPEPGTALARVASTHRFVHIHDLRNEPAYIERAPSFVQVVELGGMRSLLSMPMLKDEKLIGAISITRQEVSAFTDKQIELVQNFARPGRHRHREHEIAE
jgi:hypothetical protein